MQRGLLKVWSVFQNLALNEIIKKKCFLTIFSMKSLKVLWCSWCVIGPLHSFHFSGDTAYCEGFKQIGRRFGPFTLSTIPIGAYSPR